MQRSLQPDRHLPRISLKSVGLHPLIYRKRLTRVDRDAGPGDLVEVHDEEGQQVGYGLYNPKSELTLRMLSHGANVPDEAWWQKRLADAVKLRREILKLDEASDSYRLIHAEGDGLSGLMIDKLGDVLSAECFSIGMYERAEAILALLAPMVGTKHTLIRGGPATFELHIARP
jgi:23S rRNA (cytosine1962-C5)-methyltransferase